MKTTTAPCFSNGSWFADWVELNCEGGIVGKPCIKRQRFHDGDYGPFHCAIQKQIIGQYLGGGEVSVRTYQACQEHDCPHKRTKYVKRKCKPKPKPDNQPKLFEL